MSQLTPLSKIVLALLVVGLAIGGLWFLRKNPDVANKIVPSETTSGGSSTKGTPVDHSGKLVVGINTWGGFAGGVYFNGGFAASKESRYFTELGQVVEFKLIDDFNASREAWKSGDIDVLGFCTIDAFTTEVNGLKEFQPKVIGQIDWSRGGDAIVVRRGINQASDLKGKKIAVAPMTPSHTLLLWLMDAGEVKWSDVEVVEVANGIDAADLFKKQQVDAAVVWSPDDLDCTAKVPGSKVLVNTKTATHIIADVWLVKQNTIDKKRDALKAFLTGVLKGNAEINSSASAKATAAKELAAGFNQPVDFCATAIDNARLVTYGDNVNFFDLEGKYAGVTGEKLYGRMAIEFAKTKDKSGKPYVEGNVPSWRTITDPSMIREISLTGENQTAEGETKFSKPTPEMTTAEPISSKKLTIVFASGSASLDDNAKYIIDHNFVDLASGFAKARIRIEGNTDNVGSAEMNKSLSLKRAQAVASYLTTEHHFDRNRFVVVGNGPDKPVSDNSSADGRQRNRRTDFELLPE
jgi:NitT/TauT family transport system substrate-binding protein